MNKDDFDFVSLRDLRIGLFVDLDLGWLAHPFATSRFKIVNDRQIEILKGLGVDRIRYVPTASDPIAPANGTASELAEATRLAMAEAQTQLQAARKQRADTRAAQQQSLAACERRFVESTQSYHQTLSLVHTKPREAAQLCQSMVQSLVSEIYLQGESAIRLLTETAGDKAAMHPVNVTVISLLLARAMGLQGQALTDLGIAAMLHDIGKIELPERVRKWDDSFSSTDSRVYQEHVQQGVRLAKQMGLDAGVIQTIGQHHELADGSGFPQHIKHEAIGVGARILALVNRYDGLCNPNKASTAMTPHEALSTIFAQLKTRFDGLTLSTFVRMMGVYPPGSVVQLNDERHALVVSVNSGRPLKPRLVVHDPDVPRHEALILDLELAPNTSIRRSLKPSSLPVSTLDYLQPRQRLCYFFEPAANANSLASSGPAFG